MATTLGAGATGRAQAMIHAGFMSEYGDLLTSSLAISSPANPRVKRLVGLRKRSSRAAEGVTVVEGLDELRLAVEADVRVETLYCCPELMREESGRDLLMALLGAGVEAVALGRTAFEKASYRESPDGWLAVVPNPDRALHDLSLGDPALVLVAEAIEKPGNLGAMLRTADAAGVDAVIAASPVTDWGNPNVVRASKGAVFAVPVASAPSDDVVRWLGERRLAIVVATPDAERLVTDLDLTGGVAVVVGAEHAGVSSVWAGVADAAGRVPMAGRVNSLNVATSAALVLYEAVRQRSS